MAVKVLLSDQRVNPSAGNNQAIQFASSKGRTEVVKLLLNYLADKRRETKVLPAYVYAVDPSANNNMSIRGASMFGHTEVVKLLLENPRVDPSAKDNNAIKFASSNGHTEVVKILE